MMKKKVAGRPAPLDTTPFPICGWNKDKSAQAKEMDEVIDRSRTSPDGTKAALKKKLIFVFLKEKKEKKNAACC